MTGLNLRRERGTPGGLASSLAPRPTPSSTPADSQIRGRPAPVALLMDHGQLHAEICEPSNRPQSQDTRNRVPAPIRLGPRVSPPLPYVGRPWRHGCDAGRHNSSFYRQRGSGEKPLGRPVEDIARSTPTQCSIPDPGSRSCHGSRILDPVYHERPLDGQANSEETRYEVRVFEGHRSRSHTPPQSNDPMT